MRPGENRCLAFGEPDRVGAKRVAGRDRKPRRTPIRKRGGWRPRDGKEKGAPKGRPGARATKQGWYSVYLCVCHERRV